MRAPFGWLLPAIALAATGFTIWADSNFELALPGAVVAVTAAVLLFVEVWLRTPNPRGRRARWSLRNEPAEVRAAFRSGRLGREKVVMLLDRLERSGPNPDLPGRRIDEIRQFTQMSPGDFRRYVRFRLDELEART